MFIKILIGVGILVAVVLLLHGIRYILANILVGDLCGH